MMFSHLVPRTGIVHGYNDNDNDTQRSPSTNCQWPVLTNMSVGAATQRKRIC